MRKQKLFPKGKGRGEAEPGWAHGKGDCRQKRIKASHGGAGAAECFRARFDTENPKHTRTVKSVRLSNAHARGDREKGHNPPKGRHQKEWNGKNLSDRTTTTRQTGGTQAWKRGEG